MLSIDGAVIACASVAIAAEVLCSLALRRCARDADRLASEAATASGGRDQAIGTIGNRFVRAYAPMTLRAEANTSPSDGSLTLVFPASPGSPEAQLVDDIRRGSVSRLVIRGVLVDVAGGLVNAKTGTAAIRVSPSSASSTAVPDVQPVSLSLGAQVLADALKSDWAADSASPISRVVVLGVGVGVGGSAP